jgi:serine/threonine-protein kinase
MTLRPGAYLGAFEILGPLGEGGMGVVYRARDSRLGREVAVKVLPLQLASDEDRLSRLQREAQVLAQLNHPAICSIFGLEEFGGLHALVLELVEGPTLEAKIASGPIPLEEAIPIARDVASALEAAHEKGIVHRDLKPANVKLTTGGQAKVLDFGLAKALGPPSGTLSTGPTGPVGFAHQTEPGLVVGTAAYMSPEQARGLQVDRRTDVWAFGVLLYEMLTGGSSSTPRPPWTSSSRSSRARSTSPHCRRRPRQRSGSSSTAAFDTTSGRDSRESATHGSSSTS